jgi:hypothetical protein
MSQHNIIGSERSGPHVLVRRVPADPRLLLLRRIIMAAQGSVCLALVAIVWAVAVRL